MADESIQITVALKDEMSKPIDGVKAKLNDLSKSAEDTTKAQAASATTASRNIQMVSSTASNAVVGNTMRIQQQATMSSTAMMRATNTATSAVTGATTAAAASTGGFFSRLTSSVSSTSSRIIGGVQSLPGELSSTVNRGLTGMAQNFLDKAPQLEASAGRLGFGIRTGVERTLTGIRDLPTNMSTAVGNGLTGMAQNFVNRAPQLQVAAANLGTNIRAGIENSLSGLANVGQKAATALVTGVAAVTTKALVGGFNRAVSIQDATASTSILLGSKEAAQQKMTEIQQIVKGTPFTFPQFAKAGTDLMSFGVQANKVDGILRAVGEASASRGKAAGQTAEQLFQAIGKMTASGKLYADDLNSFSAAGVNANAILANSYGVTTDQMRTMISQGQVSAAQATDILTKGIMEGTKGVAGVTPKFEGTMAAMRQNMSGALGSLGANISAAGANLWTPIFPKIAPLVNALGELTTPLGAILGKIGQSLAASGFFDQMTQSVRRLSQSFKDGGLDAFMSKLRDMLPFLGAVGGALLGIGSKGAQSIPVIGKFIPALNPLVTLIGGLILASPELRDALGSALSTVAQSLGVVMKALSPVVPVVAGFIRTLTQIAAVVVNVLSPALPVLVPAILGIVGAIKAWSVVQGILNVVMNANPIMLIITAIGLLVTGIIYAYNNIGWFKDGVNAVFGFIGGFIGGVVKGIGAVFTWVFNSVIKPVFDWFSNAWTVISQAFQAVWTTVLQPALQAIGDFFSWVFTNIISPVFDWFATQWNNAVTTYQAIWTQILQPALQAIGDFFAWVFTNIIKPVFDWFAAQWNDLVTVFQAVWQTILQPALQAIGDFFTWVFQNIIQPIIGWFQQYWGLIVAGFQAEWEYIFKPALQAIGDFFTWVFTNIIKPVFSWFSTTWNTVSTGFQVAWATFIQPALNGIGQGVQWAGDRFRQFGDWLSGVWGIIANGVGDVVNMFIVQPFKWILDAVQHAWDAFHEFGKWLQTTLSPVFDGIGSMIRGIGDALSNVGQALGDFFSHPLGGIQDMLGIQKNSGGAVIPNSGGGVMAFAAGGVLPGYRPGKDTIPSVLSPGESVLVPELTRAIGAGNIVALNRQYSGGRPPGVVPAQSVLAATTGFGLPDLNIAPTQTVPVPVQPGAPAPSVSTTTLQAPVTIESGAVQIVVPPGTDVDEEKIAELVEEALQKILDEADRRKY